MSRNSSNVLQKRIVLKYYSGGGGAWIHLLGCLGVALFLFVRECIWNVPAISLVLLVSDHTGSLGFPPRRVVYPSGSMTPT